MDSHTLWSSALDSGRNNELVSDSLNGEAATTTATTTAPASVLSGDKAGESDCSPMILDSYTPSSDEGQESSDNGKDGDSHLLDMDHSVDAVDRPSEDLSAMFATNEFNGIQLSLSPASASHALASLDPTTLAVANLDDDYWQFIHSDLMATEALNANALQYLSDLPLRSMNMAISMVILGTA
ncbi:hypothetical protein BDF22DRAFT_314184 [Syncephalis plumigaleata]|nr:hypothetical protein BDF22DRAFT_314184 [Syncephalis plumigaleata]